MNRRLAPVLVVILLLSICAVAQDTGLQPPPAQLAARVAPPSPDASADQLMDQADLLRAQKYYLDAIDYYRAAAKKEKDKAEAAVIWNKMGIAELQLSKFGDARKSFDKALKFDKKYPDARNNLGVVYYMSKKYSKAIKNYRQAIALRETASFYANLGAAYFSKKDIARAVVEYQHALQLDPSVLDRSSNTGVAARLSSPADRAHFSYVLARMYANAGDFSRSLDFLKRAMEEGYSQIEDVYKDQEFAGLRKDPRFSQLMTSKPVAIPQ
ncbi:MAG: tetratricopeptide repeat protein [Terriglobales bacterium]